MDTHTGREREACLYLFILSVYFVIYFRFLDLFLNGNVFKLLQLPHELKAMKSHSFSEMIQQ